MDELRFPVEEPSYRPRLIGGRVFRNIREAEDSYSNLYERHSLFHAVDREKHPYRTPEYLVEKGLEVTLADDPEHAISLHVGNMGFYRGNFSLPQRGLGVLLRCWIEPKIAARDYISDEILGGMSRLYGAEMTPLGISIPGGKEEADAWCQSNRVTLELQGINMVERDKRGLPTPKQEMARRLLPPFVHAASVIRAYKKKRENGLRVNGKVVDENYGIRAIGIVEDRFGMPWLKALDIQPGLIELILEYDKETDRVRVYEVV